MKILQELTGNISHLTDTIRITASQEVIDFIFDNMPKSDMMITTKSTNRLLPINVIRMNGVTVVLKTHVMKKEIIKIKSLERIPLVGTYNDEGINIPIGSEYKLDIDVKLKINAEYVADDMSVYRAISEDTIRCGGFCDEPKELVCTWYRQGEGDELDILGEGMFVPLIKSSNHEIGKRFKVSEETVERIKELDDEWIKAKEEKTIEEFNKQIFASAMFSSNKEAIKKLDKKIQDDVNSRQWFRGKSTCIDNQEKS